MSGVTPATQREVDWLNSLPTDRCHALMMRCLGVPAYASFMTNARPFSDDAHVLRLSNTACDALSPTEWLTAFAAHPAIGRPRDHHTPDRWSVAEQAGVSAGMDDAAASVLRQRLAFLNEEYRRLHGFVFLVYANGKSGAEVCSLLEQRLRNDTNTERQVAESEQRLITELRLRKAMAEGDAEKGEDATGVGVGSERVKQ